MIRNFLENFELAIRIALFIAAVSVGTIFLVAGAKAALAASIRPVSVVAGDYIKLGDVFDGTENAEYVLGPAPEPGKDMILNARTLYKIASALDVKWSPSSTMDQVVLRREAAIIPETEITAKVEEKLRENGIEEKFSVEFMNAPGAIVLPFGSEQTMEITAFKFDPQSDSFNAIIVAPSAENPLKRVTATGRVERLVSVPVLKNSLRNGDVIGAMDIEYTDLPRNRLSNGTLLEEKDLINMTPRRALVGGKPVISNELERPKMVDRGDAVTLIFANGPMMLTVKGKSLQAGAIGDMVRVSNADSNKNLQGIVTAHREITIQ